jgi:hypothetical protein
MHKVTYFQDVAVEVPDSQNDTRRLNPQKDPASPPMRRPGTLRWITVYGTIAETISRRTGPARFAELRRTPPRLGRSAFAGRLTAIDTGAGP